VDKRIEEAYEKNYAHVKLSGSQHMLINVRPFVAKLGYVPS
jgi:hypothetical protein